MTSWGFERVERFLGETVAARRIPGAVAAAGCRENTFWSVAVGHAENQNGIVRPMTLNTIFDVASLTKVTATLPAILLLVEDGLLELGDPVSRFISEYRGADKDAVTVARLLAHSGGLVAHREYFRTVKGYDAIVGSVIAEPLACSPGRRVLYSDLGFILLGEIVRRITGMAIDVFSTEAIFVPLEMKSTRFLPLRSGLDQIAATEVIAETGRAKVGVAHDDNTEAMGGVAGHAGLFTTSGDLALYVKMWLGSGDLLLARWTRQMAVRCHTGGLDGCRGLGWVLRGDPFDAVGDLWPETTVSHTGFTGTSLAFDPASGFWAILLTNRVHFGRDHSILDIRRSFHNLVGAAMTR